MKYYTLLPKNEEELAKIKAFLKENEIFFEEKESPYNREFAIKVLSQKKQNGKEIDTNNLWESIE